MNNPYNQDDFRYWQYLMSCTIVGAESPFIHKIRNAAAAIAYERHHKGLRAAALPASASLHGKEYTFVPNWEY